MPVQSKEERACKILPLQFGNLLDLVGTLWQVTERAG